MAIQGKILKDQDGNNVYPITHVDFVIDENGKTVRELIEESGGDDGTSVTVVDNLTSTSKIDALSANQGKVLKEMIDTKVGNIETLLAAL